MVLPPSRPAASGAHPRRIESVRVPFFVNKKSTPEGVLFIWCGQQASNLHALAVEPKSTESTNSTMPAYIA